MKEFEFEYEDFTFKLAIPAYWDTIYAGKPREPLYHDYRLMLELAKRVDKSKYILDIGANHGLFAVPASMIGYKVFGFEPVAGNIETLRLAKEINGLKDFDMFHLALSNQNGNADIYVPECPDNSSFSQKAAISNMRGKSYNVEPVNTVRFDDWICEHPEYMDVGLIKIDVQGSEYNVFEGMGDFLRGAHDIYLIVEYEHHLNAMGRSFAELDALLLSYGFSFVNYLSANDKIFYKQ